MKTKVRYLRQEMGISQQDLAKKVNVARQTISALEHGRYNPSLILAYQITKILKQEKIEVARKLLQNNFSVQMIVELTELTEEEINEIKLELH